LYVSISSEGFGHSSRAIALARQFRRNEVLVGTYDYALNRVRSFGISGVEVPQEVKFIGSDGTFDVGKTILLNPGSALGLNLMVQEEIEIMRRYGVTVVVADGRMAPVLAASKLDLPCIVLTNQSAYYPFFAKDSPLIKLFGRSFDRLMTFWLSSAEEILIPDFPPPYTVCLPNLSSDYRVKKRTRFVGPMVGWDADDIIPAKRPDGRPLVVVSMGGHAYRRPLFDVLLEVAERSPDITFWMMTSFKADHVPDNVTVMRNIQDCSSYFKAADLIITPAGHSTAMEVLTLGKPSIVIPDARQIEQENNANRMVELGVSRKIEYHQLHHKVLRDIMDIVLWEPSYRERAAFFADLAKTWNGSARSADVLRDYAYRLHAY
jgi:uncharacterized protein (TIGR00661 family)